MDAAAPAKARQHTIGDRPRISLVLADQHPLVLQGMRSLFQQENDLDVRACGTTYADTRAAVVEHEPTVLVVDRQLPPDGALALLRDLAPYRLPTRIVILASGISKRETEEALRLGVRGVISTRSATDVFVHCVHRVARGGMWMDDGSMMDVVEDLVQHGSGLMHLRQRLTARELQVLTLVASGLRNTDIKARLAIAEGTVKIHLHNIYEKLGTNDRLTLALRARDAGLV
jgi:DNA-binding NarL/FixJ family response regulator